MNTIIIYSQHCHAASCSHFTDEELNRIAHGQIEGLWQGGELKLVNPPNSTNYLKYQLSLSLVRNKGTIFINTN